LARLSGPLVASKVVSPVAGLEVSWSERGNPRLGQQAKQVLADSESKLVLPVIALAESALVIDKKTKNHL